MISLLLIAAFPTVVPDGEEPLVDLAPLHAKFRFDIVYATTSNFANVKVYPVARCLLRTSVAEQMVRAQNWLDRRQPGWSLLFKDCYRPDRAQRVLYDAVRGTPKAAYVANPATKTGSLHSYGAAVDVTLMDANGVELDMGTPYDHLGKLAEPRHEIAFLKAGKLRREHVERRQILKQAMVDGGSMSTIPNEWWHFNAAPASRVRERYSRLDVPFTEVP